VEPYYDPQIVDALKAVFRHVVPEVVLLAFACGLFLAGTVRGVTRHGSAVVALSGLAAAAVALAVIRPPAPPLAMATVSPVWPDALTFLVRVLALAGGAVLVLLSWDEVPDATAAEYFGCLLLIVAGVDLTAAANELITLFLALELISIPTYVMLYLPRPDRPAQEAAVKYFLLSIFSSGLMLFGFSYLYGLTGTTNLTAVLEALAGAEAGGVTVMALTAVVMVVAGLGFRITAVPFHFYAPDVYQGTTPANAALLAFVPKVAGFVALIRLLGYAGPAAGTGLTLGMQVPLLLWILAAITMTVGNVVALWQENPQRILAYSSVAHAGYMLIGLTVAPSLLAKADASDVPGAVSYTHLTLPTKA
jgi:NADH-quinone oxidoreductase subunit N